MGYWIIYSDLSFKFRPLKTPTFVEYKAGEELPDDGNYNYHTLEKRKGKETVVKNTKRFRDMNNRDKIAKSYLKERQIKDKEKKEKLIQVLKKS